MPLRCKFSYSSAIASTHPSASLRLIASLYDWGASAVRNKAPTSSSTMFSNGSPTSFPISPMPTEAFAGSWTAGDVVPLAEDLDPSDSLGSSSGRVGGIPLLERAERQRGCEMLGCAGVLGLRSW